MMRPGYRAWLERQSYASGTVNTQCSLSNRVEQTYGDLDSHYAADRLEGVLASLQYTTQDQRRGRSNPSKLAIAGDLYKNLASYRTAVAMYRRFLDDIGADPGEPPSEAAALSDDEPGHTQRIGLERDLQTALRAAIDQLEPGLTIIDDGVERAVASGFVDIVAQDPHGATVVIELKAGTAGRAAIAQILSYMGDLLQEEPDTTVRGMLIAADFDTKARSAARMVPNLTLKRYAVHFRFSDIRSSEAVDDLIAVVA